MTLLHVVASVDHLLDMYRTTYAEIIARVIVDWVARDRVIMNLDMSLIGDT